MKKLSMAFVLAASIAPQSVAAEPKGPPVDPGHEVLEFCKGFLHSHSVRTVGDCLSSFLTVDEAGFNVHLCHELQDFEPEEFDAIFDSIGDCVTALGAGNSPPK